MLDLQYGLLMGFIGCMVTFTGFFIAFLVINYNQRQEAKKKVNQKNPMYDLMKDMPGVKYGDDCQ